MGEYDRIVVHTDFDGLIAAFLLRKLFGKLDVVFVDPHSIEIGAFQGTDRDITADLPWPGAGLWFDHHATNARNRDKGVFDEKAPSSPRVIFEHFKEGHPELEEHKELIEASDKIDFARFTEEDVRNPDRWMKLSSTLDFGEKEDDDDYKLHVLNLLDEKGHSAVFEDDLVRKRLEQYEENLQKWREAIVGRMTPAGKALVVDLTHDENFPRGNQFEIYLMHPDCVVTVTVYHSKHEKEHYKISCGVNIFCKGKNKVHLGELMKKYGGGGHFYAAGCTIPKKDKDRVLNEILTVLNAD